MFMMLINPYCRLRPIETRGVEESGDHGRRQPAQAIISIPSATLSDASRAASRDRAAHDSNHRLHC